MSTKLKPSVRKEQILAAAVVVAGRVGYASVTRDAVAVAAGCSPATVSLYFNTMAQMKRSVMRHAVKESILCIVAQGLAARDPQAVKAPEELRKRAIATLA